MMAKEITIPYYKAVKQIAMLQESYSQGHPSSQYHRAMALVVFFLSRPKSQSTYWAPCNKKSSSPELAPVDFVPNGRSKLEFLNTM